MRDFTITSRHKSLVKSKPDIQNQLHQPAEVKVEGKYTAVTDMQDGHCFCSVHRPLVRIKPFCLKNGLHS